MEIYLLAVIKYDLVFYKEKSVNLLAISKPILKVLFFLAGYY